MTMKVLIVDDEERIRNGLAAMVQAMELRLEISGVCANGIQALDKIRLWNPDDCRVVITDIKMPMMDGLKLIERVKAEAPEVHMILLSGFNEFEYARHALRNGVVDYLSKPVSRKDLYAVLRRIQDEAIGRDEEHSEIAGKGDGAENGVPAGNRKNAIGEAIRLLESDLKEPFDLLALSEKIGLNASYLSKLFKKETGKTITDYLTDARIAKAKRILEDYTDVRMYEVGSLVGYSDPIYFNKLFKKHVGMAPKEYQDSLEA